MGRSVIGPLYNEAGLRRCSGYLPALLKPHYTGALKFNAHNKRPDGKQDKCKDCKRFVNAQGYEKKKIGQRRGGKYEGSRINTEQRRKHRLKNAPYIYGLTKQKVWLYNLGICHICLQHVTLEHAIMEHVIPLCKGGGWTWDNIRPAHSYCNIRKGKMSMKQMDERGILGFLRSSQNGMLAIEGR